MPDESAAFDSHQMSDGDAADVSASKTSVANNNFEMTIQDAKGVAQKLDSSIDLVQMPIQYQRQFTPSSRPKGAA